MFCNKCGNVLDQNGNCPNCNNLNYNSQIINENINGNVKKTKKKSKKTGILIGILIIILIVIGAMVIVPFVKKKIAQNQQNSIANLMEESSSEKMKKDFEEGKITADQYVMQLAYENFEPEKMDSKYKSNNKEILYNHVLDIAEQNENKLSKETLIYLYKKFSLSDVEFDVNAKKKADLDKPQYGVVYAAHDTSLRTTLSKAKLSKNKKFLIWYTDTGDSKVNDKDIEKLADEIEDAVKRIEEESGIEYKFESHSGTGTKESSKTREKMNEILNKENIDTKYIDDVLNIYICYTNNLKLDDEKSAIAYYVPNMSWLLKKVGGLFDGTEDRDIGEMATVPRFPYINIRPDATKEKEELKLIYTHELFHHFQRYYCGNGKEGEAKSGLFTTETTANWISAKINDSKNKENIMSGWATKYVLSCETKLDRVYKGTGYANLVFAEIYTNMIEDGKKKLLDSMKHEDALQYLVEQSGDKFKDVMIELAKQNLLNEFEHQTFKAYKIPNKHTELTMEMAQHKEFINEYAMHYYWIDKKDFKYNTFVDITTDYSNLVYVLIGQKRRKMYIY